MFDGIPADEFDKKNTRDNWCAYVTTYLGRATSAQRNQAEGHDFRAMMVKIGALAIAAIEAHDAGHC